MEALKYVHAVCTKIRVVLDKGYYLLHILGSNSSLKNSLDKIGGLLSSAESVIDPRITSLPFWPDNYVPGSMFQIDNGEEDEIECLMVASLGLVAEAANEKLDNMLALDKLLTYLWENAYSTEPSLNARRNRLATLLSQFQVILKFSNLEEELENFKRNETSGPEVSHVPHMSLHSGGIDPFNYMIPEPNVREEVLKFLLQNGADGKYTVPLFPKLGGFANTDLAVTLFNDEMVKEHFELRLWVGVSSSFDVINPVHEVVNAVYHIMNSHVVAIKNSLPAVYSDKIKLWFQTNDEMKELQIEILREYQGTIRDEVGGKRFLLVLDDVLEDQMSQWDYLFTPLRYGSTGSKVIIVVLKGPTQVT